MKVLNPLNKKWEFETSEGYLADIFLHILKMFNINPEDVYIPSFLDMSNIEFRTTKKKKDQIDRVFKRYIELSDKKHNKNFISINQSITELEGGDWYAIY